MVSRLGVTGEYYGKCQGRNEFGKWVIGLLSPPLLPNLPRSYGSSRPPSALDGKEPPSV